MRIDLFLKWSRVVARRSLAKDTCDAGRVKVNGKAVRAGYRVAVGDLLVLDLSNRTLKARVLALPVRAPGKVESRKMVEIEENVRKRGDG